MSLVLAILCAFLGDATALILAMLQHLSWRCYDARFFDGDARFFDATALILTML
jgi:hypothetical protein